MTAKALSTSSVTPQPNQVNVLATVAMVGTAFFAVVMYVAFSFIQPDLNPLYRFGSEYSVGPHGWLMKLAFFVWGGSILAFAAALAYGLDAKARSTLAVGLCALSAIGILFSGVYDTDLQVLNDNPPPVWIEPPSTRENALHGLAGVVGLFGLMMAMGSTSRRLRLAGRLRGRYRLLRPLSWAAPTAFMVFVFSVGAGFAGLGQRVFLAVTFVWLWLAANGLRTRAFLQPSPTADDSPKS